VALVHGRPVAPQPSLGATKGRRDRSDAAPEHAYVELHNLLALAGAGDVSSLDAWLRSRADISIRGRVLHGIGRGLRSFTAGDYSDAAAELIANVPSVALLGGSSGQNEVFEQIQREALSRAFNMTSRLAA